MNVRTTQTTDVPSSVTTSLEDTVAPVALVTTWTQTGTPALVGFTLETVTSIQREGLREIRGYTVERGKETKGRMLKEEVITENRARRSRQWEQRKRGHYF